jgi:raffinose/stachyose/melibiose transport system permease protein
MIISYMKSGGRWLSEVLIFAATLVILIPLFLVVIGAFKNEREAAQMSLNFPSEWVLSNFQSLFSNSLFTLAIFNGLLYTVVGVVISLTVNSMCAYLLARRLSVFTTLIYYIFIAGLILPPFIITQIKVMQSLHLMDTFMGSILLYVCGSIPFSIFLMTGFVKNIPVALDEAAFVDGSSATRTFFSIILPLLKPVTVTLGVFVAIGIWNDFQTPLYYMRSSSHYPITMWLYRSVSQHSTQWNLVFASMTVAITPMIVVYAIAQKYIVDGLTAGAVK